MVELKCKGICKHWIGLINFIPGVPNYFLADYCVECARWFPKYILVYCPCCSNRLRNTRKRYAKGVIKNRDIPADEIKAKIMDAIENKNWTLLNDKKIWQNILDWKIANKEPLI
jgi:hypothetical protein